ncbi:hypothetical protein GCM10012284_62440 [Mangrovihabitans endophyticus]|uniref:CRISPR type III-associated protein domain-containing protein n=1 Tax=Mangrovihabitans endophyticus TaxID=1751298 RepID=A0A8J3C859_9ACTN|nr:hypothetical protein GCM10012284_62440 [Mangrovihabitans endophyticus]
MTLRFAVCFHTPFRVAAGRAANGADSVVDRGDLLPASSLKGVMRSAARDLLRLPATLVDAVYGTSGTPCPWSWSDSTLTGDATSVRRRARIQIDDATHTTVDTALAIAEEVHAADTTFTIDRTAYLSPAVRARHEAVLIASARAVAAVGSDRRRGLGWVSLTPLEPAWTAQHADQLTDLLHPTDGPR